MKGFSWKAAVISSITVMLVLALLVSPGAARVKDKQVMAQDEVGDESGQGGPAGLQQAEGEGVEQTDGSGGATEESPAGGASRGEEEGAGVTGDDATTALAASGGPSSEIGEGAGGGLVEAGSGTAATFNTMCCCPPPVTSLEVDKSVASVSAPGCEIGLEKTGEPSYVEMWEGESAQVTFNVSVSVTTGSSYSISGEIYVNNTGEHPADVTAVSDTVWYKAGGPSWMPAASSITTTVPVGDDAISTGPHTYTYQGTFILPVPLSSVTSMSNLIQVTISNHPDGLRTFSKRVDFSKPTPGLPSAIILQDLETVDPPTGLSRTVDSVTINGSPAPIYGPWALDPAGASFLLTLTKTVTGHLAGLYRIDNLAWIDDLQDGASVEVLVKRRPSGSICGVKFIDLDCDGERDEGEPGLEGVTITLQGQGVTLQALTDEEGGYRFTDLSPGTYLVSEGGFPGYYPTTPVQVEVELCWDSQARVDFGNCRYASISGHKWEDLDGDGELDPGEPGLAGWRITLDGQTVATTGEDGSYAFGGLTCGSHTVREEAREGWYPTSPEEVELELGCGEEAVVDFLNTAYASISGTKWEDLDGDGEFSQGDAPVQGVLITLLREGAESGSAYTGEDGSYAFDGLTPGDYLVTESLPDGSYALSPASVEVGLTSGELRTVDFLNCRYGSISGHKWEDLDGDGELDPGEPGLAGWRITLDGQTVATTGEDGSYAFGGLTCGSHTVREEAREGWYSTSPEEVELELGCGEEAVVDFLNTAYASISGTKWDDPDSDGIHDPGEPGVPNVVVTLSRGGKTVATALTASDGTYAFGGLEPGTWTVTETLPAGTTNTTPTSVTVNLVSGQKLTGVDFLNVAVAGIIVTPPTPPEIPTPVAPITQLPLTGFDQLAWLLLTGASLLLGLALLFAGLLANRRKTSGLKAPGRRDMPV